MKGRRWRLAAAVGLVTLVLAAVAWATTPRTEGLDGVWETRAVAGTVVAGRALVASDANVALDLQTGTTITLGSVVGGRKAVGGGRFLVTGEDQVDAASLDARQRWTWHAPAGVTDLTLVAAAGPTTVVQACDARRTACRLVGVGPTGATSWTVAQPTAAGTSAPVRDAAGAVPAVGVLPAGKDTVLLLDPETSRMVPAPATRAIVDRGGTAVLLTEASDRCMLVRYVSLAAPVRSVLPGRCPAMLPSPPGARPYRLGVWWEPWSDGWYAVDLVSPARGRIVSGSPVEVLRVDAEGVTVQTDGMVTRYSPG